MFSLYNINIITVPTRVSDPSGFYPDPDLIPTFEKKSDPSPDSTLEIKSEPILEKKTRIQILPNYHLINLSYYLMFRPDPTIF